jgi:DNA-binding XRE family transcriptional regulator
MDPNEKVSAVMRSALDVASDAKAALTDVPRPALVDSAPELLRDEEPPQRASGDRVPRVRNARKQNNVGKLRVEYMISKAELARRANLSVLTIDRVEKGYGCRMDTKRKILQAFGLSLADRVRVFGDD